MVGEILGITAVVATLVAAIAKHAFDYLKVRELMKKARETDVVEIAKATFPRVQPGPQSGPVDQAAQLPPGQDGAAGEEANQQLAPELSDAGEQTP